MHCTLAPILVLGFAMTGLPTPAGAAAQDAPQTTLSGEQIRVFFQDGRRLRGRLVSLTQTELVALEDNDSVTIALAQVTRIERVTHSMRDVTLAGLAIGVGAGFLLDVASRGETERPGPGVYMLEFAAIGTGIGAGIGAVLHATADRTIWPRPGHATVSSIPVLSPTRTSLGLSIRW